VTKEKCKGLEQLERPQTNDRVAAPAVRSPRAKILVFKKSSSSDNGERGVMIVYGSDDVRLNLVIYWLTLSSWMRTV